MMKASILCLTWNRCQLSKEVILKNLSRAGLFDSSYELLICDQGTKDPDFIQFLKSLSPAYLRLNKTNEGVARSLNQLIIRAKGKYFFFMPNDIELPDGWLATLIKYADVIPNSGIIGFQGQDLVLPSEFIDCTDGIRREIRCQPDPRILEGCQVFGATLFTRKLIETIGGFDQAYHPFGLEDSDFCFRSRLAGFLCYYIPGVVAVHKGDRSVQDPEYLSNKTYSFMSNLGYHRQKTFLYYKHGIFEKLPELRDELT